MGGSPSFRVEAFFCSYGETPQPAGAYQSCDSIRVPSAGQPNSLCAVRGSGREPSSQPALGACVDRTVANAFRQIDALRQTNTTVRKSVTRGANVSLADLDLSTLEGARIARERLKAMARRLCRELARRQDLSYQPSYAACVQDTLAGALAQADALAAARNARTAQRSAP